jgi:hypothetical protein
MPPVARFIWVLPRLGPVPTKTLASVAWTLLDDERLESLNARNISMVAHGTPETDIFLPHFILFLRIRVS